MTTTTLDNQLNEYWPLLEKEEKQSMLTLMKSILKFKKAATPQHISIEQYNKEIDEAEAEMNAGHFISQEDAKKQAESWFSK